MASLCEMRKVLSAKKKLSYKIPEDSDCNEQGDDGFIDSEQCNLEGCIIINIASFNNS